MPTDFRLYDKPEDGLTKNEHFRTMLAKANERGFKPRYVLFDSWYAALENLKKIRHYGWEWLCRLKSNRLVNPDKKGNVAIQEIKIPAEGREVHLKGYGMVKVFGTVAKKDANNAEHQHQQRYRYWATSDIGMSEESRKELEGLGWGIARPITEESSSAVA